MIARKHDSIVVLSTCPPRASETEDTREALELSGYPVAACIVTVRRVGCRCRSITRRAGEAKTHPK
jgi:hypothetical protein